MQNSKLQGSNAITKALALGTGINLIGVAARVVLVFLHSYFAARLYGAEAYGIYSIGIAAVILLSLAGQIGFERTLTRFVAFYWAKGELGHIVATLKLVLHIAVPVSIGIGLALGLWAEAIARIFGELTLVSSFRVLGFAIPALTLATLLAAFTRGFKRMYYSVIALDIVRPGVELFGLLALAWLGAQQFGLSIAYTLSVMLSGTLLIHYASCDLRRLAEAFPKTTGVSSVMLLKPVLSFAMPVMANNILVSVADRAIIMLLGVMGTSTMVGVFSILQRVVILGLVFMFSTNMMFGPMVADLVEQRQFDELSRLYKISTRWMLIVSLPFFLILAFFGAEILQIFGREFVNGSVALWYLVAAAIFDVSVGSAGIILIMSGHPRYSVINELIKLAAIVSLSSWLIPQYGLLGAAWTVALGTVIVNALRLSQVWWHLRIQPYDWPYLKITTASVAMVTTLWVWKTYASQGNSAWYWLILGCGLALLTYGGVLIALGLESDELTILQVLQQRLRVRTQISSV